MDRRKFLRAGLLTPAMLGHAEPAQNSVIDVAGTQMGAILYDVVHNHNGKPNATHAQRMGDIHDTLAVYVAGVGLDHNIQTGLPQLVAKNGRNSVIDTRIPNAQRYQIIGQYTGLMPGQIVSAEQRHPVHDDLNADGLLLDGLISGSTTVSGLIQASGNRYHQLAASGKLGRLNTNPRISPVVFRQGQDICELWDIATTTIYVAAQYVLDLGEILGPLGGDLDALAGALYLIGVSWQLGEWICCVLLLC